MMKKLILSALLLPGVLLADSLEWRFDTVRELKDVEQRNIVCTIAEDVKTPDYYTSLRINPGREAELICKTGEQKPEHGINHTLSFYIKSARTGKASVTCGSLNGKEFPLTPDWRKLSFPVAGTDLTPRFKFPEQMTVWLGPVAVEPCYVMSPYSLKREYFYRRGATGPLDRIPEGVQRGFGESLVFGRPKAHREPAMLWMKIPAEKEGRMDVAIRADWYFECWLNGVKLYSTLTEGNRSADRFHRIFLPLKKGENLLAVRIQSGSGGFGLVWRDGRTAAPVRFIPSECLKPVNMERYEYRKGTVLDFSGLLDHAPAGKFGRVIVNRNGKLAFEKRQDPIRFKAFNFVISDWRGRYELLTHKELEDFADRIAVAGYNMVRFHFLDRFLVGFAARIDYHRNFDWKTMPLKEEELRIDPKCYDAFAYLFHCLKERGIYSNVDMMTSKEGYVYSRGNGLGCTPGDNSGFKWNLFFNNRYRDHYFMAVRWLMTRKNPYTGMAMKDDPAVACVTMLNEQDLRLGDVNFRQVFTKPFRDYLRKKYPDDAKFRAVWGKDAEIDRVFMSAEIFKEGSARSQDIGDFIRQTMGEMTEWYQSVLRRIGYKGLWSQWDMVTRNFSMPVQNMLPVIMNHTYFNHPSGELPGRPGIRPGRKYHWATKSRFVEQTSSLDSAYFRALASIRFADRPFMMTEFSHSAPNRFRHERGLYFSSYAALQDWDCLTVHSNMVTRRNHPDRFYSNFDSALDPMSRVNETLENLIFLRGDVKAARHRVELVLKPETMFPENCIAKVSDDYDRIAMLTRLGVSCGPKRNPDTPEADVVLVPTEFGSLSVQGYFTRIDPSGRGRIADFAELLRKRGILPDGNRTDPGKGIYESETGELLLNAKAKTMQVVTPRLEGCIVKKDGIVSLNCLNVRRCSVPACIAAASLNPRESLEQAERVLLVIATDGHLSGQTFQDPSLTIMTDPGESPVLIRCGKFHLQFRTARRTAPRIYALNMDGSRAEEVSGTFRDGLLSLRLDTSKLKYGTPYFEIVF